MVDATNERIRGRKDVLAPKIKELRTARTRMAELKAAHEEARGAYQKVQDTHEARMEELEGQVAALQAAVDEVRPHAAVGGRGRPGQEDRLQENGMQLLEVVGNCLLQNSKDGN